MAGVMLWGSGSEEPVSLGEQGERRRQRTRPSEEGAGEAWRVGTASGQEARSMRMQRRTE